MQQRQGRASLACSQIFQVPPRIPASDISKSYVEIADAERGRKPALDAVRKFYRFRAIKPIRDEIRHSAARLNRRKEKPGCYADVPHFVTREAKSDLGAVQRTAKCAPVTLTAAKVRERGMAKSRLTCYSSMTLATRWRSAATTMPSVVYEIIDHRYGWHLPIFAPVQPCRRRGWRHSFTTHHTAHQRRLRCHRRRWFNDGRLQRNGEGWRRNQHVTAVTGDNHDKHF